MFIVYIPEREQLETLKSLVLAQQEYYESSYEDQNVSVIAYAKLLKALEEAEEAP